MKKRVRENVGMVKKQASVMNYEVEDLLWKQNVLGEETPDQLQNTVLFLIGINCGLRAGDEHYDLHRDSPNKPSQLTFKRNKDGVRCLVYSEDTITKTNDGGIDSLKKDRKVRWIHPSDNVNRCTVRLVDKYMSLCPPVTKPSMKPNFYLRSLERTNPAQWYMRPNFYLCSLERTNPAQWYSTQVVGLNTLKKTVGEMLKNTKLDGFFSNHSLHRTGISRLFQAGVPPKLIKEYSGHHSEALDRYQIPSEKQIQEISSVLAGPSTSKNDKEMSKVSESAASSKKFQFAMSSKENNDVNCVSLEAKKDNQSNSTDKVTQLISNIVNAKKGGKTVVKIEIEFHDD